MVLKPGNVITVMAVIAYVTIITTVNQFLLIKLSCLSAIIKNFIVNCMLNVESDATITQLKQGIFSYFKPVVQLPQKN
jgi:hypothetical protein